MKTKAKKTTDRGKPWKKDDKTHEDTRKKDDKTHEDYQPSNILKNYLEERLYLYTEEQKKKEGEDLPPDIKRQKKQNQDKRMDRLKIHVFQAMANLIFFFEFINLHHPELQEEFEHELEELLMGRNDKSTEATAFARFVWGATHWDYDKDRFNFRLSLLFQMQKRIMLRIPAFAKIDFDEEAGPFGISESIVKPDMEKAFAWVRLYAAKTVNSEKQKEWQYAHRPMLF